jgi:hypothetical protein
MTCHCCLAPLEEHASIEDDPCPARLRSREESVAERHALGVDVDRVNGRSRMHRVVDRTQRTHAASPIDKARSPEGLRPAATNSGTDAVPVVVGAARERRTLDRQRVERIETLVDHEQRAIRAASRVFTLHLQELISDSRPRPAVSRPGGGGRNGPPWPATARLTATIASAGRDSGGAARCHENSSEHEQRAGDRHRDAAAISRNEPVRRSKRAREAAKRARGADPARGASDRDASRGASPATSSGGKECRAGNIGSPNNTAVADERAAHDGRHGRVERQLRGQEPAAERTRHERHDAEHQTRDDHEASRQPVGAVARGEPPTHTRRHRPTPRVITPMTLVHTDALSPKCGANTRTAVSSPAMQAKPAEARRSQRARVCGGAGSVTRRRAHFFGSAFGGSALGTVAW